MLAQPAGSSEGASKRVSMQSETLKLGGELPTFAVKRRLVERGAS